MDQYTRFAKLLSSVWEEIHKSKIHLTDNKNIFTWLFSQQALRNIYLLLSFKHEKHFYGTGILKWNDKNQVCTPTLQYSQIITPNISLKRSEKFFTYSPKYLLAPFYGRRDFLFKNNSLLNIFMKDTPSRSRDYLVLQQFRRESNFGGSY